MANITLNHITKIEGHAKLNLGIDKGKVTVCELSATEGSRYFEGLVKGRQYFEATEMTSRICGICSCGHVIASISAIERAIGFSPSLGTMQLRRLLTLGERIRSHATHLYFLALPDYLGYESALAMAGEFKKELKIALGMMKVGNHVVSAIGGRDLHPVSAQVGGWLKWPSKEQLQELAAELQGVMRSAQATVKLFASLKQQPFSTDGNWYSLHDDIYAMLDGSFLSPTSTFEQHDYHAFIKEHHEPYSTANFVVKDGKRYFVSSLARLNNNADQLLPKAKLALKQSGLKLPSVNPFDNNLAQAIELVQAIEHAIAICQMHLPAEEYTRPAPRAGNGIAAIEVPRGTLWHEYTVADDGTITFANIVTPTAQNLYNMQEDVRKLVPQLLKLPKETIIIEIEKLIRAYDPCFSCSAHFLEVNWV